MVKDLVTAARGAVMSAGWLSCHEAYSILSRQITKTLFKRLRRQSRDLRIGTYELKLLSLGEWHRNSIDS